jgi:hypothetical protein
VTRSLGRQKNPRPRTHPAERVMARLVAGHGGCWIFTGATRNGYGAVMHAGYTQYAHRVIYEDRVGPIPEGLTLDHVKARGCTSRRCVNPDHLEPVPAGINSLRGEGAATQNARKTACPQGHPYDVRWADGSRRCSRCRNAAKSAARARRRAGVA